MKIKLAEETQVAIIQVSNAALAIDGEEEIEINQLKTLLQRCKELLKLPLSQAINI